ncbi:transcription-repair coupling factor [Fervidibacillus halotolerans]|uniref:Transcription-repair-coupling factor n=1 Tax=Fervidibacillus halotolerans TaxID=2980027 RepID=A0A9E8RX24_9BACI|nr:transcription-repair coupling factor [Fervidibacillus halotolerans]WAA12345.1 transcription-repair coupling factor [Fervidibacillus halotolerans]
MEGLYTALMESDDVINVSGGIEEGLKEQLVAGLSGSSRTVFIASLYKKLDRPLVIVTYNLLQAQKLYDDIIQLLPEDSVYLYPANEVMIADMSIASPELKSQRIETLNFLVQSGKGIMIVPVAALRKILPPKNLWKRYIFKWKVNEVVDLGELSQQLIRMGYVRSDMVSSPGEFSIRGGIIDIYPLTETDPLRIELFDDTIESIRSFSVDTQRSKTEKEEVTIGPAAEMIFEKTHYDRIVKKLEKGLTNSLQIIKDEKVKEELINQTQYELEQLKSGTTPDQIFKYLAFAYDHPASLLDYVQDQALLLVDEVNRVVEMKESLEKEEAQWKTSLLEEGKIIHDVKLTHDGWNMIVHSRFPVLYFSLFLRHIPGVSPQNIVNVSSKPMQNFHGQIHVLKTELERWRKSKFTIVFLGADEERIQKLEKVFDDYDVDVSLNKEGKQLFPEKPQIVKGNLNNGFELPMFKLCVITEGEIFNKRSKKNVKRNQNISNAERIKSYSELNIGDYVVHVNHGIGKYLGIETLQINGVHKDYLQIKYQGNDQLYVPIEQIDLVQKYVGTEGKEPKIYKLGGSEWKRVKRKVASSVEDIADDLIKLYAERQVSKGFAFSKDTDLQREFEVSFPYQETEDQLRSIEEIKRDMEKPRPMDRLLCGDVGYGKTEVALRAAFKAIMDGKQVAILVPTTILAQQHYETMRERFQDYPIKIGILNRFRTRKQQQETLKGLKAGTIDIVVGTHRLLSKDVQFRDLGLLIIDEEQRFGVTHKEKIKQLKSNIDVLTLTATPIPRTLHMSLLGVRDLSVIETPPENRFPVQTYVTEYNLSLVKEAVERELARDGQVYYLYNRVEDIERKAEEINQLIPDARVTYAHGRMNETELENVLLSFLNGEYDVLVSTTIIETGIDIPNVNTLIVENADRMGLSQLYQLRGRVGRSNRVAYAYFTYKRDKVLTEVAEKRLQTIKEFTELGSGFKIAMRDLSIRGTGNILGAQQHGFIESVGFEMYSQMLKEAIEKRKGEVQKDDSLSVEIDIGLDAYIPDEYISDGYQKIEMYKRVRGIEQIEDITELQKEMIDRFGKYPKEVDRLFSIAKLRVWAGSVNVESIKRTKDGYEILFKEQVSSNMHVEKFVEHFHEFGRMIGYGMDDKKFKMVIYSRRETEEKVFSVLMTVMEQIPNLLSPQKVKSVS